MTRPKNSVKVLCKRFLDLRSHKPAPNSCYLLLGSSHPAAVARMVMSQLPVPQWLPEIGMVTPTDPVFVSYNVSPKKISAMLVVSRQLPVQQTGRGLDEILIDDISRQLASYLDQCALYGGESVDRTNQCAGVAKGVAIDPANLHPSFCAVSSRSGGSLRLKLATAVPQAYGLLFAGACRCRLGSRYGFGNGVDSCPNLKCSRTFFSHLLVPSTNSAPMSKKLASSSLPKRSLCLFWPRVTLSSRRTRAAD